jgi:MFS superfamily sulfate permease-like transporter
VLEREIPSAAIRADGETPQLQAGLTVVVAHRPGLALGLLVIAIMVAWRWVPAKVAPIPGPLVAIVVVTVISLVFPFHVSRIDLDGSVLDALQLPALPDGNWGAVALGIITVTLITSVQSLLTAVSIDRMHHVLASVPERTTVTVHLLVNYLDHAAHQAITDWQRQHCATGGTVEIRGAVEVGRLARRGRESVAEREPASPRRDRQGRLVVVQAIPETSQGR